MKPKNQRKKRILSNIIRSRPLRKREFEKLDWKEAGMKFWRDMAPICLG